MCSGNDDVEEPSEDDIILICSSASEAEVFPCELRPVSDNHLRHLQMNMQESDFRRALEIITRNNRITVSFTTPLADNYSRVYPLLIHEQCFGTDTAP